MQIRHSLFHAVVSDLSTVWIMLTLGAVSGFAMNQFRDEPLPLVYAEKKVRVMAAAQKIAADTPVPYPVAVAKASQMAPPTVHYVGLADFRKIVESQPEGFVLDARPEIFHRLGHVPGALSLPREEFEASYGKQRSFLERDKARPIAVYCSNSGCEDSQMVADALLKLNYSQVFVFKGGWSEWTDARLPEEKAQ